MKVYVECDYNWHHVLSNTVKSPILIIIGYSATLSRDVWCTPVNNMEVLVDSTYRVLGDVSSLAIWKTKVLSQCDWQINQSIKPTTRKLILTSVGKYYYGDFWTGSPITKLSRMEPWDWFTIFRSRSNIHNLKSMHFLNKPPDFKENWNCDL